MRTAVASIVFALTGVPLTAAEPATSTTEQLVACAAVADNLERLTCFDRLAAPLVSARRPVPAPSPPQALPAPPPVVRAPQAQVPSVAPAPASSFGEEQLKGKEQAAATGGEALRARIASTRRGGQGTYLLTLDNGQVWRHEVGSQVDYLKVGEAITITRAALGSYRLTLDSGSAKNWVRVTRVR